MGGGMTENELRLLQNTIDATYREIAHAREDIRDLRLSVWAVMDELPCRKQPACPAGHNNGDGNGNGNPRKTGLFWRALNKMFHVG